MPPEDSLYPADWLRVAEKHLDRLERMLRDGDAAAAGFYLQQALEKLLKGFLLLKAGSSSASTTWPNSPTPAASST